MTDRAFILYSDDTVEEVDAEGETINWGKHGGLYAQLVINGYPLMGDEHTVFDGCLDITTDPEFTTVTVHTTGKEPRDHRIEGPAADLFLGWVREEDKGRG
jgi:hypothetical protein